jgi:hypothetical protein
MGDSTENVGDGHGPSYEAAKREASVHALEYYLRPQGKGSLWNDRWSDLILLPDSRKHFGGACTKGALTKDFDQSRFDLLEPEGLKKERLIKQTTAGASYPDVIRKDPSGVRKTRYCDFLFHTPISTSLGSFRGVPRHRRTCVGCHALEDTTDTEED